MQSILNQLDKLKETKPKRGMVYSAIACCPAHDDKSPSLQISETLDGKLLLHCFAGCDYTSIADAMGISTTTKGNYLRKNTDEEIQINWSICQSSTKRGQAKSETDKQFELKTYLEMRERGLL